MQNLLVWCVYLSLIFDYSISGREPVGLLLANTALIYLLSLLPTIKKEEPEEEESEEEESEEEDDFLDRAQKFLDDDADMLVGPHPNGSDQIALVKFKDSFVNDFENEASKGLISIATDEFSTKQLIDTIENLVDFDRCVSGSMVHFITDKHEDVDYEMISNVKGRNLLLISYDPEAEGELANFKVGNQHVVLLSKMEEEPEEDIEKEFEEKLIEVEDEKKEEL